MDINISDELIKDLIRHTANYNNGGIAKLLPYCSVVNSLPDDRYSVNELTSMRKELEKRKLVTQESRTPFIQFLGYIEGFIDSSVHYARRQALVDKVPVTCFSIDGDVINCYYFLAGNYYLNLKVKMTPPV